MYTRKFLLTVLKTNYKKKGFSDRHIKINVLQKQTKTKIMILKHDALPESDTTGLSKSSLRYPLSYHKDHIISY